MQQWLAAAVLLVVLAVSAPPSWAQTASPDYDAAMAALNQGAYEQALAQLVPLAEQGQARAQYTLGEVYQKGWGVARDPRQSAQWFALAAAQGVIEAVYQLAWYYYSGYGVTRNLEQAVNLFRQAATVNHPDGQYYLGLLYYQGKGVRQSFVDAADLFYHAAEAGHAAAFTDLGLMNLRGDGMPADATRAARLFSSAAELGDARGMINLALCYVNGVGVVEDRVEAYFWATLAMGYSRGATFDQAERLRRSLSDQLGPGQRREQDTRVEHWRPLGQRP